VVRIPKVAKVKHLCTAARRDRDLRASDQRQPLNYKLNLAKSRGAYLPDERMLLTALLPFT
jgi:hypothetical protein